MYLSPCQNAIRSYLGARVLEPPEQKNEFMGVAAVALYTNAVVDMDVHPTGVINVVVELIINGSSCYNLEPFVNVIRFKAKHG